MQTIINTTFQIPRNEKDLKNMKIDQLVALAKHKRSIKYPLKNALIANLKQVFGF